MPNTDNEQQLMRTLLAANEYIRQLEAELNPVNTLSTRAEVARINWERLFPEAQNLFL